MDNVSKSRTTLIIAHKLSTVQKADNIAVMSQGNVVEQGTHRDLLMRNGAYARLVRAQTLEQPQDDSIYKSQGNCRSADEDEDRPGKLERSKTNASSAMIIDGGNAQPSRETMGYSLIQCFYLLIKEQPRWWPLYAALAICSLLAGKLYPSSGMCLVLT